MTKGIFLSSREEQEYEELFISMDNLEEKFSFSSKDTKISIEVPELSGKLTLL